MYARVARFTGANREEIDRIIEGIEAQDGPPEGVPAKAFKLFADKDNGNVVAISFYESEEDMRAGDAVLNEMSPPAGSMGRRASVDLCEVALERES
jgi:hypothetical protein